MSERAVRFANPDQQAGFTQIPNVILRDASLSAGARLTYAMLESFAWQDDECWPGQAKLGSLVGVKDRAIRNYLTELETAGLLEIEQQGLNKPNRYLLLFGAGQERHQRAGQERHQRADKEDTEEKDSVTERASKRQVNRKAVSEDELSLAAAVVQLFNSSAGTSLSVDAHLTPIVGRIRERPHYTEAHHRRIIEAVFAGEHWWTGPPTPKVIYGNPSIFEQSIEMAKAYMSRGTQNSDPNAERERVRREFKEAEEEDAGN